jgi:hypothetical protein
MAFRRVPPIRAVSISEEQRRSPSIVAFDILTLSNRTLSAEDGNASSRLEKRSSGGITAASPTTLLSIQVGANAQNTIDPSSDRLY